MDLETLKSDIGNPFTNRLVERLHQFAYIPPAVISQLANDALTEEWGRNNYVLSKYLAVHVAWSIEQGEVTFSEDQFYISAGHLQTRYGTPLYLVFCENDPHQEAPWRLLTAGSRIQAPEFPTPPLIPEPRKPDPGAEIVMSHDHLLQDHPERVDFLLDTPPVAQMCAIAGAIQWSLNRNLILPYWYYGSMNFLVPLYLKDRENIANSPDLVAPVQVSKGQLLVRTVLEPYMPYANARVSVQRHDQLPPWMVDTWNQHASTISDSEMDDPESAVQS